MNQKDHWERAYSTKLPVKLGWYEPHLQTSLNRIKEINLPKDAPIIDTGGGASTLVDDLLEGGCRSITVLDISEQALSVAKARLGNRADLVKWIVGDITSVDLPTHHYEVWHDRAVFHFLTEPVQRRKYRDNLLNALKPGGHLIIGTFAPEAPPRCSGLPVQRYSLEQLKRTMGGEFDLKRSHKELHVTPGGVEQTYLYCHFRRETDRP
ncbi:MAG TPA: class I SAM-dependent methyltransferase [Gammaproteobacteria bacterium]|nr:class I SAM-dependent methyltransferase [Gammaproteobacteria bacterium]